MTDSPPPGWYPDPAGGPSPRWWTGRDWAAPAASAGPVVVVQPPLPAGTSTWTVWITLQCLLLLVSALAVLPYLLSFQGLFAEQIEAARRTSEGLQPGAPAIASVTALLGGVAFSSAIGVAQLVLWVVFAVLDVRVLRARGIVQPFPWPWSFLGVVYPIGRAVVVRRRTGAGLGPLWLLIGCYVASVVLMFVLIFVLFGLAFAQLAPELSRLSDAPTT